MKANPHARSERSSRAAELELAPRVQRCAIYTRKSTTKGLDAEFSSLESQRESAELYIRSQAANGWNLLPTRYDDGGFTGGNLDRPALEQLLEDIERGLIDIVVCYKVDRLCRSLFDFASLMKTFIEHDVSFVSVTQSFDTSTSMGRLTLNILLSFAQFEREIISERTRDKIQASRRRGKWTGGVAPHGYQIVDKRLVPEPSSAAQIRKTFELYLSQGSTQAVAWRMARETGSPNRTPWNKDRVARILKNPLYAGLLKVGSDLHVGEHEPLVPRELFEKASSLLATRRTVFERHSDPEYILRGILRCECGAAIVPATTHKNGKKYRYYRCSVRAERGDEACKTGQMTANTFEDFIAQQVAALARRYELGTLLTSNLTERMNALRAEHAALPRTISEKSAKAAELATTLTHLSGPARRGCERQLETVSGELSQAEARLYALGRELLTLDTKTRVEAEWLEPLIRDLESKWEKLDLGDRGRLLRGLLREVLILDSGGRVELQLRDWIVSSVKTTEIKGAA